MARKSKRFRAIGGVISRGEKLSSDSVRPSSDSVRPSSDSVRPSSDSVPSIGGEVSRGVVPTAGGSGGKKRARKFYGSDKRGGRGQLKTEDLEPEKTAHVIELLADGGRIGQILKEAGFEGRMGQNLLGRLRTRHLPLIAEVRKFKAGELLEQIEEKLALTLHYLDDVVLSEASASQLAVVFGILSDKRALLMGLPTQILSVTERIKLDDLVPELLKEAHRRGQEVEMVRNSDGEYVQAGLSPIPYDKDYRTGGFREKRPTVPEK